MIIILGGKSEGAGGEPGNGGVLSSAGEPGQRRK